MAFLELLESLSPLERAVFLLRGVFDYEYAETAQATVPNEMACRQLFSRAKSISAKIARAFLRSWKRKQRLSVDSRKAEWPET